MKLIYASATRATSAGEVIVKVVNTAPGPQETEIDLRGAAAVAGDAQAIVLTSGDPADENTLEQPRKVAPVCKSIPLSGTTLKHTFPGNSVTVLRIKAR
jgi:alpha-L-arabinofuranosidase